MGTAKCGMEIETCARHGVQRLCFVAVGKVGLAKQRWEMAIHELENSKLGVREQKRLAWIIRVSGSRREDDS